VGLSSFLFSNEVKNIIKKLKTHSNTGLKNKRAESTQFTDHLGTACGPSGVCGSPVEKHCRKVGPLPLKLSRVYKFQISHMHAT
jgi:hypothetical protein